MNEPSIYLVSATMLPWSGSRTGPNYACGANTMIGPEVIQALGDRFEATENRGLRLEERLLRCLETAQATGGDNRGRQSAAIQIHWKRLDPNPYLDLRVDDNSDPIPELRSIVHIYRQIYPEYASRTWPVMGGTGGYPVLYP